MDFLEVRIILKGKCATELVREEGNWGYCFSAFLCSQTNK